MLRVRIRTPTDPETTRDFSDVRRVTFGRASDNDLVLEGTYVSRLHGELLRLDGSWCAINHGSRTPLALLRAGGRTEIPQGNREPLRDGDVLQILHTRIEVELDGSATATDFGLPFVRDGGESAIGGVTEIRPRAPLDVPGPLAVRTPPRATFDRDAHASELAASFESFVAVCAEALDARSGVAPGHARRVASYAVALARALRRAPSPAEQTLFSPDQLHELHWAALLHEFGTLALPDAALRDSATPIEYAAHVEHGCALLERVPWPAALRGVPALVRMHHERLDGSGYPRGLAAGALPTAARVLAIADLFDAVQTGERGRAPLPPERSVEVLRREARAGRLDAVLVELLASERPWCADDEEETLS
jgi:HD-GYP domain-containing protein (c-di-GMP phosphodiesterase class II)